MQTSTHAWCGRAFLPVNPFAGSGGLLFGNVVAGDARRAPSCLAVALVGGQAKPALLVEPLERIEHIDKTAITVLVVRRSAGIEIGPVVYRGFPLVYRLDVP